MSRKHYIAIAAIVRGISEGEREQVALALADLFERDNFSFDRSRFLQACKS